MRACAVNEQEEIDSPIVTPGCLACHRCVHTMTAKASTHFTLRFEKLNQPTFEKSSKVKLPMLIIGLFLVATATLTRQCNKQCKENSKTHAVLEHPCSHTCIFINQGTIMHNDIMYIAGNHAGFGSHHDDAGYE